MRRKMKGNNLEIRRTIPEMETQIVNLFRILADAQESDYFQPHPLTPEHASIIANYHGNDFYSFALLNDIAIGYGMLRGWDDGYDIPSLGLTIHPQFRGVGIGSLLIHYLHTVAMLRGCDNIRLRVNNYNYRAIKLYKKLGYEFKEDSKDYLLGFLKLK